MSYRTCVNDFQIFGNNDYYEEWLDFIKSQGIVVNEAGCYDGYITDVMGAIEAIEKVVLSEERIRQKRIKEYDFSKCDEELNRVYGPKSIFDLTNISYNIINHPEDYFLLDELIQIKNNGYMFFPLAFLEACGDQIEKTRHQAGSNRFYNYKIKDGCKIHVVAR